jgi:hypothetical protein
MSPGAECPLPPQAFEFGLQSLLTSTHSDQPPEPATSTAASLPGDAPPDTLCVETAENEAKWLAAESHYAQAPLFVSPEVAFLSI